MRAEAMDAINAHDLGGFDISVAPWACVSKWRKVIFRLMGKHEEKETRKSSTGECARNELSSSGSMFITHEVPPIQHVCFRG